MSADEVSDLLYKESGLKGLSGISGDMRDLLASDDPRAAFAIDHFVTAAASRRPARGRGRGSTPSFSLPASARTRPRSARASRTRLAWLGAELDPDANDAGALRISTPASRVAVLVVVPPTRS
jgi:acetate kinase